MDGVINSRLYANGGCSSNLITNFPSSESARVLESLWVPTSCVNFTDPSMMNFDGEDDVSSETEEMRNPYRQPEKKRRLSIDQVKQLEKSFEIESKLEPDRKIHLAKELGLQPRQVAIWFQNRRARFKTKQLEREYDSLKANYDSLKSDFDSLLMEKERLQNEVSILTNKLKSKSEPQPGLTDPVLLEQFKPDSEKSTTPACKQEDASSVKSDIFDSESPHCVEANEALVYDMIMVKPEQSELSPEVEDLRRSFRYGFGEVFDVHGNVSSCNLGVNGMEEQSNYWPWLY